ncbi:MAG: CPBP family intramembrane metalloprotease [Firmicutes bacterium]|nr:CPBP family intramembrane metalloprotease [Bacillota bacterium]
MPFQRDRRQNYFVSLIALLLIIAVFCTAAFLLAFYLPGTLASPPFDYETKDVYNFEPCSFDIQELEMEYPEGGLLLPLYRNEKQEAALISAPGEYRVSGKIISDPEPSGIFIISGGKDFEEMRDCIICLPSEDTKTIRQMVELYERQPGLPLVWAKGIPLTFVPTAGDIYYYFLSDKDEPVWPPLLQEPPGKIYGALALYGAFLIIVLLIITIFSLGRRPSRYWNTLYETPPDNMALGLAAAAVLPALAGELLPGLTGWPEPSLVLGYLAAGGLIFAAVYNKHIYLWDFGISLKSLRRGYFPAVAAAFIFMIITRGIPQKFFPDGAGTAAGSLLVILIIALSRELIWRGCIQTVLGRRWGAASGLLLTALLAGLVHFAVVALSSPELLLYPYTLVELLILAPGSAIVLGYLYLRTENILSCVLLHGLLLSIASLITF